MNDEILALVAEEIGTQNQNIENAQKVGEEKLNPIQAENMLISLEKALEEMQDVQEDVEVLKIIIQNIDGSNETELQAIEKLQSLQKNIEEALPAITLCFQIFFDQLTAEQKLTEIANRGLQLLAKSQGIATDPESLKRIREYLNSGGDIDELVENIRIQMSESVTAPESETLPAPKKPMQAISKDPYEEHLKMQSTTNN